jgi:hypothetical protein
MSETEPSSFTRKPGASETKETPKPSVGEAMPGVLQYGAGAGRFEGMEARIASLEAHVDHIRDDVGDIKLDVREMTKTVGIAGANMREFDSRISSLPTKGWMIATLLVIAAAICAVIIYLEQIRHYLGVLPPSVTP